MEDAPLLHIFEYAQQVFCGETIYISPNVRVANRYRLTQLFKLTGLLNKMFRVMIQSNPTFNLELQYLIENEQNTATTSAFK
jgi:hypothetical protein